MATLQDSKKQLQEDFILLRKMNNDLINDLSEWGEKKNVLNKPFMHGLSLVQCINILKEVKEKALTDENYSNIQQANSKDIIDGVSTNMGVQIRHHKEVRDLFNLYISNN